MTSTIENSLRDYQRQAVSAVESRLRESDRAYIVLASGTGKSRILIELTKRLSLEYPTLIVVDRAELAFQLSQMFRENSDNLYAELITEEETDRYYAPVRIVTLRNLDKATAQEVPYGLVVVLDMGMPEKLKWQLKSGFFARSKQLFFSSIKDRQIEKLAGEPIFEYSYIEAQLQGYLKPLEYRVCTQVDMQSDESIARFPVFLSGLKESLSNNSRSKALIVCNSISEAERVYEVLQKVAGSMHPILLHSKIPSVRELLRRFNFENKYSVAIVVDLYFGLNIPNLTDLVLLRKFFNEQALMQAISRVMRLGEASDIGCVWDFAGNQHLFNQELGRLVNYEVDIGESLEKTSSEEIKDIIVKTGDLVIPLEDKPAKVDLLGRKGLVDILKGLIERDTKDHLIIALFGHWGSGKSSVIQMLRDKYDKAANRNFTEFNAWQAEHSNSMSASIAQQLVNDLYGAESLLGQILLSFKARILQSKAELLIEFVFVAIVTAFCFGFALPGLIKDFKLEYGTLAALSLSLPAVFSLAVSYLKHPFTGQLKELARRPNFKEHIGLGHAIREQIFCLLSVHPLSFWQVVQKAFGKKIQKEHKYILAIDDLDRCSDKKIIETLEAIQLIVDLPSVNILLAVAPDILLDAVASRYKQQRQGLSDENAKHLARDFLGKVLQITITLDKPTSLNRNYFINTRLYSDVEKSIKTAPNSLPKIDLETNKKQASEEILDFTGFVDEDDQDYDRTESYLKSSNDEYEFFVKCSEYFDIHNPRTLIRIHNAVTLLKGVYPAIYESDGMLNHYIYLTFWHEIYATVGATQKKAMLDIILPESADPGASKVAVNEPLISFENLNHNEIKTVLFRVKNMSLPAIELG